MAHESAVAVRADWVGTIVWLLGTLVGLFSYTAATSAQTVTANDLVSSWLVTVEGETRTRTFKVVGVAAKNDGTFMLDATYGWSDGRLDPVRSEVSQSAEGRKLTLTTPANSVLVATQSTDGNFTGTITYTKGTPKSVKLAKMTEADVAARAASAPVKAGQGFLNKEEFLKLVVGKDVRYKRKSDGQVVRWSIKNNGDLYGQNESTRSTDSATWTMQDDGSLCVKWIGNSRDSCQFAKKQGESYTLHSKGGKLRSYP